MSKTSEERRKERCICLLSIQVVLKCRLSKSVCTSARKMLCSPSSVPKEDKNPPHPQQLLERVCESATRGKKEKKKKHSRRDLHIVDHYSDWWPNIAVWLKKIKVFSQCRPSAVCCAPHSSSLTPDLHFSKSDIHGRGPRPLLI